MTIKVTTPDDGVLEFDANNWELVTQGGLWVGIDDVGVAQFTPGAWRYVIDVDDDPKPEPRVWDSLEAAEYAGAKVVTSAKGCRWRHYDNEVNKEGRLNDVLNGWYWSSKHADSTGHYFDKTAPFTEVWDRLEDIPEGVRVKGTNPAGAVWFKQDGILYFEYDGEIIESWTVTVAQTNKFESPFTEVIEEDN